LAICVTSRGDSTTPEGLSGLESMSSFGAKSFTHLHISSIGKGPNGFFAISSNLADDRWAASRNSTKPGVVLITRPPGPARLRIARSIASSAPAVASRQDEGIPSFSAKGISRSSLIG